MAVIVQKFGGTSLSSADARARAVHHIEHELKQSHQVVVVVSAMGRLGDPYATDTLLALIEHCGGRLPHREKDLLLGCGELISASVLCSMLSASGISSTVFTGGQAGIITNEVHGDAKILSINTGSIHSALNQHQVVVVTGFQGVTANGEITTLGRGGSDTSATALGVALQAERVDIFTDVSGIFTADPRMVNTAKPIHRVSYSEICQMAQSGAKVIHPRAVEVAMSAKIPLRIRSTFQDNEGTWVCEDALMKKAGEHPVRDRIVTGIASTDGITQIKVQTQKPRFDLQSEVFRLMAEHRISVDFVNMNPMGVIYTVYDREADQAANVLREHHYEPQLIRHCAKVSVIGGGMNGVPGIMARIVETLTRLDISILQCADSYTTVWVLIHHRHQAKAVNALHDAFQLGG